MKIIIKVCYKPNFLSRISSINKTKEYSYMNKFDKVAINFVSLHKSFRIAR